MGETPLVDLDTLYGLSQLGTWEWRVPSDRVSLCERMRAFLGARDEVPTTYEEYLELVHPEDRDDLDAAIREALERSGEYRTQHRVLREGSDGLLFLEALGRVERDPEGNPVFLRGVARDVSDRVELERQLERSRRLEAVGQLAGGIAHDFNNLLGVVLGYAELIQDDVGDDHESSPDLVTIRDAALRARDLTRRLLTFSRQDVSSPQVLNLSERVRGVEKMLQRVLGSQVTLTSDVISDMAVVYMDPSELDQVIMNLAINARDAMPSGGALRLQVWTRELTAGDLPEGASTHPGLFSSLVVEDSGHGVAPEVRERIFEPFFSTKVASGGTGLGLATVLGIVSKAGGLVELESTPGKGARFEILLPCAQPRADEAGERSPTPAIRGGGETILVVDDQPEVLRMHQRMLEKAGYRVMKATGAGEALLLAEKYSGPLHALVTDLGMPYMNGIELVRRLRALRPATQAVIVTGSTQETETRAPDMDEVPVLTKPVQGKQLLATVRELLDQQMLRLGGSSWGSGVGGEGRAPTPQEG